MADRTNERSIRGIPGDLWKQVKIRALAEETTAGEVVRRALESYCSQTIQTEDEPPNPFEN